MRVLQVAKDVDLDGPGTAVGTAIDLAAPGQTAPFLAGYKVVAAISVTPWAEAEVGAALALQGRETTSDQWTDLVVADGGDPTVFAEVTLPRYIRYSVQSNTTGDGRGSIHLLGN